jgi:hypothetical protein
MHLPQIPPHAAFLLCHLADMLLALECHALLYIPGDVTISCMLCRMCKELGHDYKVEFCSTYDRMHAKMQELRQTVGM